MTWKNRWGALGANKLASALCVLLIGLGGVGLWMFQEGRKNAAILLTQEALHKAMDEDVTVAYRSVVKEGLAALQGLKQDPLIEEMVAYAATILAVEHQDEDMLALSHRLLSHKTDSDLARADLSQEGYLTAARILSCYGDGDLTLGLSLSESIRDDAAELTMAKLEGLRLMVAAKVDAPIIFVAAPKLGERGTQEGRALVYLGLWHLSQNNTALGGEYLRRARALSPAHPQAQLGLAWVNLQVPNPSEEALWKAQQMAGEVLRLPPQALTPPVRATALLVRARSSELEGDVPRAEKDRAEAAGIDPANLLLEVTKELPSRP